MSQERRGDVSDWPYKGIRPDVSDLTFGLLATSLHVPKVTSYQLISLLTSQSIINNACCEIHFEYDCLMITHHSEIILLQHLDIFAQTSAAS